MAALKIYTYHIEKETGSEKLVNTTMLALPIVRILAKHMPDRLIRMIDTAAAEQQLLTLNPKTIARFIEDVMNELEQQYSRGPTPETMLEFVAHFDERIDENGDTHPIETRIQVVIEA